MHLRRTALVFALLGSGCAVPPPPAPRLVEPSGLARVWIETLGLE